MNQDFTVQKSNICLKKKFVQRGSSEKKNPAQAVSEKKKIRASWKFPTPPPLITFLMARPLSRISRTPQCVYKCLKCY